MPTADHDLLNAAPAGFLSFRDSGEVVAVNDALLTLLGYPRHELLGLHVERLFGVAARIFYQTHLFPLIRLHGHVEEIYIELRSARGERVPVLLNARRDELDGAPVNHCVVIRVHERKKYEDELLRAKKAAEAAHAEAVAANEAKSRYLRSVSHEIRTPINALLGYADLLELGAGRPMGDVELGYVGRVRHAARHLLTLVNDILDLAKIESGAMAVNLEAARVVRAADAAFAMVEPQAREHSVQLLRPRSADPDDPADPGTYVGDHERVVQILINLLSNAVKFTDPDGRVELDWGRVADPGHGVRLNGGGPWLRVRVTDTGIGIPADQLDDVFQPFKQVIEKGRESKGTGLGLAISRELARLMGGEITVRSEPGQGSTFSLWLPAAAETRLARPLQRAKVPSDQ
ncbi:MAG TPA: ATP-binding protein [Longimicrobiales bacterium]|nr:ATP-binding protein [Longimicrobiales bacterium]